MVVIGIIAVVTAIVIPSFKSYDSNVLLTNAAYTLALTIRQTQFYGISVKQGSDSSSGSYSDAYGIHFDSQKNSYVVYQDIPNNGVLSYSYDSTNPDEFVSSTDLDSGYSIQKICFVQPPGDPACADSGSSAFIDVEFDRPNPDAIINTANIPGADGPYLPSTAGPYGACIYLMSTTNTSTVYVDKTGQISVNSPSCPSS